MAQALSIRIAALYWALVQDEKPEGGGLAQGFGGDLHPRAGVTTTAIERLIKSSDRFQRARVVGLAAVGRWRAWRQSRRGPTMPLHTITQWLIAASMAANSE
jgi:hypothetical protein